MSFTFRLDMATIKKVFAYSLGNFTADLFVNAPLMIVPFLIINTIGPTNNAYYYIAYSISSFLFMIPHGISVSLFVEGSHDLPLAETTIRAVKLLMVIMVPALIVTFLFGNYILMIFNAEYAEKSFELLKLLAISSIFSSVISIYVSILRVKKNIRMVNIVYSLYAALIIVVGYVFLMFYGLSGIGYAWVATCLIICLFISYNLVEKYLRSIYDRFVHS
jgi:O-antigen/teichoic acid export membrane protein